MTTVATIHRSVRGLRLGIGCHGRRAPRRQRQEQGRPDGPRSEGTGALQRHPARRGRALRSSAATSGSVVAPHARSPVGAPVGPSRSSPRTHSAAARQSGRSGSAASAAARSVAFRWSRRATRGRSVGDVLACTERLIRKSDRGSTDGGREDGHNGFRVARALGSRARRIGIVGIRAECARDTHGRERAERRNSAARFAHVEVGAREGIVEKAQGSVARVGAP